MKRIIFTLCIMVCAFSCSSTDDIETQTVLPSEPNFYALKLDNSWIYKNYKYNATKETYEDTNVIDSVSIVGTEVISGETYFKFRRVTTGNEEGVTFCNPNGEHFEYLRAFDGSLITSEGKVKFTNNDFSQRVLQENTWGSIVEQLVEGTTDLSVEAGSFTCINSERYAILSDGNESSGLDRFYYAEGLGLIYDTSSFVSKNIPTIIRRLDSYDVN